MKDHEFAIGALTLLRDMLAESIREEEGDEVVNELKESATIACEIAEALALGKPVAPKPISLDLVTRYNELVKKHFPEKRADAEADVDE